jgi:hypothetical protein
MAAAALAGYKSGETSQANELNWKIGHVKSRGK